MLNALRSRNTTARHLLARRSPLFRAALPAALALLSSSLAPCNASAAVRTWIGGNTTWTDATGAANWNPADEPDPDDDAVFDTPNSVVLGSNNTVLTLTLSAGIGLDANGYDLTVDGLTTVTGVNSVFTLPANSNLASDSIAVSSSAYLYVVKDGSVTMIEETGSGLFSLSGGTLIGQGTVSMTDGLAAVTTLFNNNGTIVAGAKTGIIVPINPAAGTLTISASDSNARINLDGTLETGVVTVGKNQTLIINVQLADTFNSDINLSYSTLNIRDPWTLGTNATVDVTNGATPLWPIPGIAHIAGGALTQTGGTITVADTDGTLQFDAPFTMNGGNLVNNGTVVFNASATIAAAANFTMPTNSSSLTVGPAVAVTVNQANFDVDGPGFPTSILTIGSGGSLALNLGAAADTFLQCTMNLNGGSLAVSTPSGAWTVAGPVNTGDGTGNSFLSGGQLTLSAPAVTIGTGSTLVLNSSAVTFSGGSYTGAGTLRLDYDVTYVANTTIAVDNLDWDGAYSGSDLHTINSGVTLTITSPVITDAFDDNITINGSGGTLAVNGPASWTMTGDLTTNPANAGTSTIAGTSRMRLQYATFAVPGNTTVSAPVTFAYNSATTVSSPATLTLTGPSTFDASSTVTIAAGAHLTATGDTTFSGGTITGGGWYEPAAHNAVTSSSSITVASFNFDGPGSPADRVWTVSPGATLTVNVTSYDPDSSNGFQSIITLDSGSISVNSADAYFIMDGTLNMNNTTGTVPTWSGEPVHFGDDSISYGSHINVGGTGASVISAQTTFNSDADVTIAAGASLVLTGAATFTPVNGANNGSFTGTGIFVLESSATFSELTTLNLVGGAVDLDGRDTDLVGATIAVNAPLVINAKTLGSFGKANLLGTNVLNVDHSAGTGTLTVHLDSAASEWTLNSPGVLNLVNDNTLATLLAGNPLNVDGTINVTGNVRSTARLDIGSTGIVNINTAGQPFRLGGGTLSDPNTIAGGSINSPGTLAADSGHALRGFGTINPNIDFDGTAELRADNGTLVVNGTLLDIGIAGTADSDGVLNLVPPQTLLADMTVELLGGSVTGGALTNNGLVRGTGVITNNFNNSSGTVRGVAAGTLKFTGGLSPNSGRIELNTGTVEFNAALTNAAGGVIAGPGTLRANSNLTNQGSIQVPAGGPTAFFGAINSTAASSITIGAAATPTFYSNVTLQLGSSLTAAAGSTNRFLSALTISGTATLANDVAATSIASLTINASGTFDTANNRLIIDFTGAAAPDDTIRSYLFNGRLFSSTAAADPQRLLAIGYAQSAELGATSWSGLAVDNTALLTRMTWYGDANLDGRVNADDLVLLDHYAAHAFPNPHWVDGDFNYDGFITSADYLLIDRSLALQGPPLSPAFLAHRAEQFGPDYVTQLLASIPEPSAAALALALLPAIARRRRRV